MIHRFKLNRLHQFNPANKLANVRNKINVKIDRDKDGKIDPHLKKVLLFAGLTISPVVVACVGGTIGGLYGIGYSIKNRSKSDNLVNSIAWHTGVTCYCWVIGTAAGFLYPLTAMSTVIWCYDKYSISNSSGSSDSSNSTSGSSSNLTSNSSNSTNSTYNSSDLANLFI